MQIREQSGGIAIGAALFAPKKEPKFVKESPRKDTTYFE
jgi:hypothetical protein